MLEDVEIALTDDGMIIGKDAFVGVSDTCKIKWDFGEEDNIYYNLLPFDMPSYEVDINVLQDYNNKEYTITKGERVKKEYTITFDANGGECDVESMIVEEGGVYENLPVPTREGFEFVGWIDVDGNVYKDGERVGVERNLTLVAKWYNKNETETPYQQIENIAWTFGEKEIKTANYNNLRKISNETLSMKPIYRLNKRNTGVFYSYGNDEELNYLEFTKEYDEKNADFLFGLINNYNNGDVLWIVTKESYESCPKNLQGIVVNSELSKEDLKRALTLMHCKYFQYLTFVQYPYTDSEERLNKRENTVKGYRFFVQDWEISVTHPIAADVYPVEVSLFHKYYNYCDEMNTGLEKLLNNVFIFDTNTTVVDAILAINEYVLNHTGFDDNPLKGVYSSDYIHLIDGKYYLQVNNKNTKKDFVEIYIDSNKFVRDINVDEDSKDGYFEAYIDAEGYHINRHRIYDLIWFLRDTSDDRNKKKDNEYHHGVCASYSKFLHTIMGKCGYEALIVGGSDAPGHEVHSFSKTPLDGKDYYCDITDTYNRSDNPTQWLFFTKCDYVDNHGEPRMDDPFNGEKIVFTDEDTDLNVTLDACGGKMEIYYNVDKKITKYYESPVASGTRLGILLNDIKVYRKNYIFKGWYTSKIGGTKLDGNTIINKNMKIYAQWTKIKIKRVDIKKLTYKKGKINVKFSKVKNIDSYIIQISSKKNFKSGKTKEYNVNKSKKNKKIKVKKNKIYYVRVRGVKKDSIGNNVYGKWSKTKKVRAK